MPIRQIRGLEDNEAISKKHILRDVRPWSARLADSCRDRSTVCGAMGLVTFYGLCVPETVFFCSFMALVFFALYMGLNRESALPFKLPMSAHQADPNSPAPGRFKSTQASGIFYLGNSLKNEELWLDKNDILTHTLLMGTTGSGKTETLVSLSFNALATGTGLFYIDPKASPSLSLQIWKMARSLGRDDDFRVLNYGTAGKGSKVSRITNTNNPFSLGNAEALTQILLSLMPPSDGGSNSVFADKAQGLISGIMYALVDLRDKGLIQLSVSKIRDTVNAEACVHLVKGEGPFEGMTLSEAAKASLKAALLNCNWVESKPLDKQEAFFEQFGYAQSYFGRALSSLTDTYGHIYGVEAGEVDFADVVLNRRILVTLLPAMEKSPQELSSLGKITLSSVRAAAAVGLGMAIEGDMRDVLSALPIHFQGTGPFLAIVDEYAAIVTPGFEILLTQGRGLGMATIVASQDYAGIVEADKKGAQQIVANTNLKVFMRMSEPEQTWNLLKGLSGQDDVIETSGYQVDVNNITGDYRDNFATSIRQRSITDLRDLMSQIVGEAHYIYQGQVVRGNTFYANPNLENVTLRVPRMLQMEPLG